MDEELIKKIVSLTKESSSSVHLSFWMFQSQSADLVTIHSSSIRPKNKTKQKEHFSLDRDVQYHIFVAPMSKVIILKRKEILLRKKGKG